MSDEVYRARVFRARLLGEGRCRVGAEDGRSLEVVKAPEYGGAAEGFSSTDLVAAALGACIATSIEPILERHSLDVHGVHVEVAKILGASPRRIARLEVEIRLALDVLDATLLKVERAASSCVVARLLGRGTEVRIEVRRSGASK